MSEFNTNWTKTELSAYTLLYCAHANFRETSEELELVKSKVDSDELKSIRKEFKNDNDYQSIQKIQATVQRLGYTWSEIDDLISEIKTLFLADGTFDQQERTLFSGLKKILENKIL
jgi:uncharacterized protein YlbG (UPF0298 family)